MHTHQIRHSTVGTRAWSSYWLPFIAQQPVVLRTNITDSPVWVLILPLKLEPIYVFSKRPTWLPQRAKIHNVITLTRHILYGLIYLRDFFTKMQVLLPQKVCKDGILIVSLPGAWPHSHPYLSVLALCYLKSPPPVAFSTSSHQNMTVCPPGWVLLPANQTQIFEPLPPIAICLIWAIMLVLWHRLPSRQMGCHLRSSTHDHGSSSGQFSDHVGISM